MVQGRRGGNRATKPPAAFKLGSSPGVSAPVRVEPPAQVLHVFAYVGSGNDVNTSALHDASSFVAIADADSRPDTDVRKSFRLLPGERRGWWSQNLDQSSRASIALVDGAVCNARARILLDSGSTTSILSLDLARRLKLSLDHRHRLRVNGIGGVTTHITAKAAVKITLGRDVVYFADLWVGNIGEGVECLLGMDFMVAAGVRLCALEGSVHLPDEERIPLVPPDGRPRVGAKIPICNVDDLYVGPGDSVDIPIIYGSRARQALVTWVCAGPRWLTTAIFDSDHLPRRIRVFNTSRARLMLPARTAVAVLVEEGFTPERERCVRVGSTRYYEWQQYIYESTHSKKHLAQVARSADRANAKLPPSVEKPSYPTPMKILSRRPETKKPGGVATAMHCVDDRSTRPESGSFVDLVAPLMASEGNSPLSARAQPSSTASDAEESERSIRLADPGFAEAEECAEVFHVAQLVDLESAEEASVYFHEGSELELLRELRSQLAVLPDLDQLDPPADLENADVGEPDETTPEELARLKSVLQRHAVVFLGNGNALPPAARGVICDLEVESGTKPIAQRARRIPGNLLPKVYELLRRLLESGIIEPSTSEWASPIVIVMKKNGVDIRLCIDYRLVNQLIKLLAYPLPLIDELLDNFEAVMWFLSLDMASGFWAIAMTTRAKLISAFICPLGHFQWVRMPFGLKNAPLIYQKVLDNCLWGFVRLPPWLEREVDPEVLEFFGLDPADLGLERTPAFERFTDQRTLVGARPKVARPAQGDASEGDQAVCASYECPAGKESLTVFELAIPALPTMRPVLRRSSYIDDIAYGAASWDDLCTTLDALLYRLRYWGISVSLPKSSFGKRSIPYLSHEVGREGLKATPKALKELAQLPFPSSLKQVQSFLGSLNYYAKFIEDFPVLAGALYELTDAWVKSGERLERAMLAFESLKVRLADTPVLRHPDRSRSFVVILHANPWAASAVLGQEHDGVVFPVRYTGRTLHDAETRYHPAEVEILALLRVLTTFYSLVVGKSIKVYTRFSVLKWLFQSRTLQGRCLQWAALLSPWTLQVERVQKDEDGLAALVAASITPREHLDELASQLTPYRMSATVAPLLSVEMLSPTYAGLVLTFDGSAKLKSNVGSSSFIVWQLPAWEPVHAEGLALTDVTVNEAEYRGLLSGLAYLIASGVRDVVVIGDSRLAIEQCQGTMRAIKRNLEVLLAEFHELRRHFDALQLLHVPRDFNAAADHLATTALRLGESFTVSDEAELTYLCALNRLPERMGGDAIKRDGKHCRATARDADDPDDIPEQCRRLRRQQLNSGGRQLMAATSASPPTPVGVASAHSALPHSASTSVADTSVAVGTNPGDSAACLTEIPGDSEFVYPRILEPAPVMGVDQILVVQTRSGRQASHVRAQADQAAQPARDGTSRNTSAGAARVPAANLTDVEPGLSGDEPAISSDEPPSRPDTVQPDSSNPTEERWRRILGHQAADADLARMIKFLHGQIEEFSWTECQVLGKQADQLVLDQHGVLRYMSPVVRDNTRPPRARLVVPVSMRADVLHMCHTDVQGGHQGVTRTYQRAKQEYYWLGMFKDVEQYVGECVDCVTSKGRPRNPGPSPGNLAPEYPFQVVSMDFVLPLPATGRGNTALLLFQCIFSGYVMCKAMSSTTALEVAQAYEEVVFRRFGASSYIRHD